MDIDFFAPTGPSVIEAKLRRIIAKAKNGDRAISREK